MYTKEEIFKAVSTVNDPEVGFNLVEMGLIYDAVCDEKMNVIVTMTLSTKACPLHQMIIQWVEEAVLRELEKVEHVEIDLVWEPAWNISMAQVKIITTWKCYNMNPQKLEQLLHNFFGSSCLNIDIFDENKRRHTPREWFIAPLEVIEQAIQLIINGEIVKYCYDIDNSIIIKR